KLMPALLPERARAVTEVQRATLHVIAEDLDGKLESHDMFPIVCLSRNSSFNSVRGRGPHYLEATGTAPGTTLVREALRTPQSTWVETLADAACFAESRADVQVGKLGVIGSSLGGNLALRLAKLPASSPKIRAVVDSFAPSRAAVTSFHIGRS